MNQALRARLFVLASLAFLSASDVLAQISVGGKNDPLAVTKNGFCGQGKFIDILTNPLFLGIMGVLALISYGYQTNIGKPTRRWRCNARGWVWSSSPAP
ncbi:MAG: hypothetical protein HC933_12395 [Pleurocapsa sp. SU_196_0]|nr:hypothetical protein [Pleurocapsa sp. SU_196_0]